MEKGARVIITNNALQSYNHVGTFVGYDTSAHGFKIYLDEPIGGKNKQFLVSVKEENFKILDVGVQIIIPVEKREHIVHVEDVGMCKVNDDQLKLLNFLEDHGVIEFATLEQMDMEDLTK